jgi:hypothetical protein
MNGWQTLSLYVLAGVVYVSISVAVPEAILSWVEGAGFLLLAVAVIPLVISRLRR